VIIKFLGFYLIVIITFSFVACSSTTRGDSNSTTKFPEGRNLYVSKCTACHKAYERELHTTDEWQKILDEMGSKAKLTDKEKQMILNYLSEKDTPLLFHSNKKN
jgi:hypothetical protein